MPPRRSQALAAALLAAFLAGATILSAQPLPPAPEDRRRALGDWLVEHVGEEDGGRIVRLTREADDYRVEYHFAFWRGNAGPVRGGSVFRLNAMCGAMESRPDAAAEPPAAQVRAELADHLDRCGIAPADAAAALGGFERAYALASAWAEEAAAATAAEAAAIADYGADMIADENMVMDMDAAVDMNATVDANMTGAGEPQ